MQMSFNGKALHIDAIFKILFFKKRRSQQKNIMYNLQIRNWKDFFDQTFYSEEEKKRLNEWKQNLLRAMERAADMYDPVLNDCGMSKEQIMETLEECKREVNEGQSYLTIFEKVQPFLTCLQVEISDFLYEALKPKEESDAYNIVANLYNDILASDLVIDASCDMNFDGDEKTDGMVLFQIETESDNMPEIRDFIKDLSTKYPDFLFELSHCDDEDAWDEDEDEEDYYGIYGNATEKQLDAPEYKETVLIQCGDCFTEGSQDSSQERW